MNCLKSLDTERLVLKTLTLSDISKEYVKGLNDPDVNKYLVHVRAKKQTRKTVELFVSANSSAANAYLFGLFTKNGGKLIGTIRVHEISRYDYSCTVGICIFDKLCWNKGYAGESMKKIVRFIFDELGMHYIEAGCYKMNTASEALFIKVGFKVTAVIKNKFRYEGRFVPAVYLGKVNPRFDMSKLNS